MDAVDREIKRKVDEAKERLIVIADPYTPLFCLDCGAPVERRRGGWMSRYQLREYGLAACKGLDWYNRVGDSTTVNLAIYELEDEGVLEKKHPDMRLRPHLRKRSRRNAQKT